MAAPLPSEISQSLIDKFYDMDIITQKKFLGNAGNSLINLDKTSFFVATGSLLGMIGTAALSVGGTIAVLGTPVGPIIAMGMLTLSATSLVGSAVLGGMHSFKNKSEQKEIKTFILKEQYGINDNNKINDYVNRGNYEFHKIFQDAVYNDSVKQSMEDAKLSSKVKSSIVSIRNKLLKKDSQNDLKII